MYVLVDGQRALALDHSELALPVGGDAADFSEDAIVGQWFWPGGATAKVGISLPQRCGSAEEGGDENGNGSGKTCGGTYQAAIPHLRRGTLPCFAAIFPTCPAVNRGEVPVLTG